MMKLLLILSEPTFSSALFLWDYFRFIFSYLLRMIFRGINDSSEKDELFKCLSTWEFHALAEHNHANTKVCRNPRMQMKEDNFYENVC